MTVGTVLFHISNLLRRGKTVMLDCGIHPGYSGKASLPYFDEIEMEDVDAMLVTHFHLDHCAAVPYVTAQTPFKVRLLLSSASSDHCPVQNIVTRCWRLCLHRLCIVRLRPI